MRATALRRSGDYWSSQALVTPRLIAPPGSVVFGVPGKIAPPQG